MNLTENRLYTSDELTAEVHIEAGVSVMIFDEADVLTKVTFGV